MGTEWGGCPQMLRNIGPLGKNYIPFYDRTGLCVMKL